MNAVIDTIDLYSIPLLKSLVYAVIYSRCIFLLVPLPTPYSLDYLV